jgi:deoxyadenosine/deoxycytidine kinase
MPLIFSIDGNIGSGKSTLVEELSKRKFKQKVIFLKEPVQEWNDFKDDDQNTILTKFYNDQTKYSFPFQLMAYISRISQLRKAIDRNPSAIFICERSVLTDKNVFAKMLYDMGKIEKICYDIYLKWFDEFRQKNTGFIYIKTKPKTSYERVKHRNRTGEETVSLKYLNRCHSYHEEWLKKYDNILILDGDTKMGNNPDLFNRWHVQVEKFIYKTIQADKHYKPKSLFYLDDDYPIFM